jgi:hypothetical protein
VRLTRRPGRDEVRRRVEDAVGPRLGTTFTVDDDGGGPLVVSWHAGPAPSTVLEALGELPGWDAVAPPPGLPPTTAGSGPLLVLRRELTERALAVGVVRFQASAGRPWSSLNARDHDRFAAILDADHPSSERCGYPVVDEMVDLLLAEPDPHGQAPRELPTPSDELAWRLEAAGYDRLWAVAWSRVS